jgi:hypothetical protein
MFKSYEIDYKKIDRPTFFRSLGKYFPDATTLYVGGGEIAEDVKACYLDYETEKGPGTDFQIWYYGCLFSKELMEELIALSESHDFPELLERLSLYRENDRLLQWNNVLHDAKIWVSSLVPDEAVGRFAHELGLKHEGLIVDDLCACALLSDRAIVPMGVSLLYHDVYETLEEVKQRGDPYLWLSANKCRLCGQWWLVAQEDHNDVWCLRRLNQETADRLLKDDLWPPDFDNYSTLLSAGLEAGIFVSYHEPENLELRANMALLAGETPGIRVSELAKLLNLDMLTATILAQTVVREKAVHVTFDTIPEPEEVRKRLKRLKASSRALEKMNGATNRLSRSLTPDEERILQLIQQIYGNQNSIEKCVMTDEGDIAIWVANCRGRLVIPVNLTFVADIAREQNLTDKGLEVWLKQ